MRKFIIPLFAASVAFAFTQPVLAKDTGKHMTAHQSKFAACAHQSKGIKGDAHRKFMSACLKGNTAAAAAIADAAHKAPAHSQHDKMKTCNADAKSKKLDGDARKAFMSKCLKGSDT